MNTRHFQDPPKLQKGKEEKRLVVGYRNDRTVYIANCAQGGTQVTISSSMYVDDTFAFC